MTDWKEVWNVRVKGGDTVKFLGEGGFEYQLETALSVLQPSELYTIDRIHADMWGVYYYLVEVPNYSFPEDMFERI